MIPTPDLSHLPRTTYEHVYEPAEDTFILLDALEADRALLRDVVNGVDGRSGTSSRRGAQIDGDGEVGRGADGDGAPDRRTGSKSPTGGGGGALCVEIGSGSGCASAFLSTLVGGPTNAVFLCTDINPHATRATVSTGRANGTHLEAIQCSLLLPLLSRLRSATAPVSNCTACAKQVSSSTSRSTVEATPSRSHRHQKVPDVDQDSLARRGRDSRHGLVDVLVFNPPYVPTSAREEAVAQHDADLSGSWAGGLTGTTLVESLLDRCGAREGEAPFAAVSLRRRGGPGETPVAGDCDADGEEQVGTHHDDPPSVGEGIETLLSARGVLYLVAVRENRPYELADSLRRRGLEAEVVLKRRAGGELLHVVRAMRPRGGEEKPKAVAD